MPLYVFEFKGVEYERLFPISSVPDFLTSATDPEGTLPKGIRAKRILAVRSRRAISGAWPILSNAAGVTPAQVSSVKEKFGEHHEFTKDGRAIFRDRQHRRRCLKDRGMVDMDSYTGY